MLLPGMIGRAAGSEDDVPDEYAARGDLPWPYGNGNWQQVPVPEVVVVDAFSAHADSDELVAWATSGPEPSVIYLVHGEPEASATLAERLSVEHGWCAVVPHDGEHVLV